MAQIFLGKCPRSLAVNMMARYTRAIDADLVKITEVTPDQQKALDIATVPCMVVSEAGRTFKCASPFAIFRHIAEITRFESIFLGRSEMDNHQILSYFELINSLEIQDLAELLNNDLKLRMFLVSYNITAADIYAYAHIVSHVQNLQDFEKLDQNNLFRWIDHIQHLPGIAKFVLENHLSVSFPDENAKGPSKRELKKMAKKQAAKENKGGKKEKGLKEQQNTKAVADKENGKEEEKKQLNNSVDTNTTAATSKKDKKKQKQQNQPKKGGKQEEDTAEPIAKLDIRVGKITKVWKHPDSTKLYCEEVDIGEDQPRSIASGLQEFVPIEKMENAMVVVLANLKARKLAGFASHGMVLCGETPDRSVIELLTPPEGSVPGDKITIKGYDRVPPATLPPKKKIFESVVDDLRVDENGVAKYKDAEFTTEKGVVTTEGVRNGKIA